MSGESAVTAMERTETANQGSVKINSNNADTTTDMEVQILAAMRSRVTYLKTKADSVTFASVRRLLEEDMGLEKYALDAHKSFVKDHLVKCLEDPDGASDNPQEKEKKDDVTPVKEVAVALEEQEVKKDVREETVDDEKRIDDEGNREALMSDIKRALRKRASYVKANSEEITMASLRRLLEGDLKLKKDSLVPFKKFINKELDEVLQIPDSPKHSTKPAGKSVKKKVKSTPSKKVDSEDDSDSDAEEAAVKKTPTQKRKRKIESGKPVAGKKKAKQTEVDSENDSDEGDTEMKAEKPLKQGKVTATTVYGKRVEHLRSVIKSCGMSIPPVIYRKVKQAPEDKREATLIEELEQILAKEGLSSDPSEKEIKEVKKQKERSKELEGIDTSNIVSSSRRRSTTSFVPPPKPKITSESESDEEESENGEDNEEEEEEGNEEAEGGSQSEEESNNEDDDGEEESE
ncbi:Translation initiation factor [Hirschfeldia incana]|nr:Translation initiation factor [Hirschfeldia incana]